MKKLFLSLFVAVGFVMTSCEKNEEVKKSSYAVDEEKSTVIWKGYSPEIFHDGSFAVSSTNLEVVGGKVKSGTFVIPIASIKNFDLPENVKPALLGHLQSPDFFNVALHPEAKFTITNVRPLNEKATGAVEGSNCMVTGNFTLIGNTNAISFPAKIETIGNLLKIDAVFSFDRTQWGMNYAADPALGEHHIKPNVDIRLDLTCYKK